MKGIFKAIIAVLVVSIVVVVGVKTVNKVVDSPKNTIERFEKAYNSLDIDGVIECFEPSVQSLYSGANSIMGDLIGFDISDIASFVPFIAYFDDDINMSDMPKIKIDVKDVNKTSDTTAVVLCEISYSQYLDSTQEEINMVKIDGDWYFSISDLF